MKKHLLIPGIFALCFTACGPVYVVHQDPPPPPPAAAPAPEPEDVSYQTFYDQLSPYGQWIDNPQYGYVWLPDAGPDFKPYASNGHWVYTDEGWTWDSGYPWGWATFHYGRWFFQDGYGWSWIPGNEWAPAWVSWRNSDDYYGWAPMGPNVSFGMVVSGGYNPPPHYWCFVPHQYVASPQINNYYVRETNNVTIINRTTIINNTTVINRPRNSHWGAGPDPNDVGRYGGAPVRPVAIRETRNPGEQSAGNGLVLYRPRVNQGQDARPGGGFSRPAPARYQSLDNARPVNRNSYGNGDNRDRDGRGNGNPAGQGQPFNRPGNQPAYNQPVNNQPANNPPFTRPGSQPVNNQPVRTTPGYSTNPGNNNPAGQGANQPVNNQPAYNRPFTRPGAQPGNNQPAYNQPATNQPYNRGGNQQPVNNPPVNNPPAGRPQQIPGRPANAFGRPFSQTDTRPVVNQPRPVTQQQRVPPPPPQAQKPTQRPTTDDPKKDSRP